MYDAIHRQRLNKPPAKQVADTNARTLYNALMADNDGDLDSQARLYLAKQLDVARSLPIDAPPDIDQLSSWTGRRASRVGEQYRDYLTSRRAGRGRQFFSNPSHALYFLRAVAPTKLVDGAWLHGALAHWDKPHARDLIRTYLEELGDGVPGKNHVLIYKALLAAHGCEQGQTPNDSHYVQGAIQLSLARCADTLFPELLGYNLGYEQLPLHLLITAYELNELDIDPWYFTLHVTIDNAASGHAQRAVQAIHEASPHFSGHRDFYPRVLDGYRLNELGASTQSIIAGFDLESELIRMLAAKSTFGKNMHSDYCRIGGLHVNDWLADPALIPAFLDALQQHGWIRRGEAPENSRFWRLLHGERAEMFGVFDRYEEQLLNDWITMPAQEINSDKVRPLRARSRASKNLAPYAAGTQINASKRPVLRPMVKYTEQNETSANELRRFNDYLASLRTKEEVMKALAEQMSPQKHHSALGLMATRIYSQLLG